MQIMALLDTLFDPFNGAVFVRVRSQITLAEAADRRLDVEALTFASGGISEEIYLLTGPCQRGFIFNSETEPCQNPVTLQFE